MGSSLHRSNPQVSVKDMHGMTSSNSCAMNIHMPDHFQLTAPFHIWRLLPHVSAITHGHYQEVNVTERPHF